MAPCHTPNAQNGGMIVAAPTAYLPPDVPVERVVCCLGLVSDTHMPERCRALPPALFEVLLGVDLLLHAGDVGELAVLDRLSATAPVIAVHGNDDTEEAQRELPYQLIRWVRHLLPASSAPAWCAGTPAPARRAGGPGLPAARAA